MAGEQRQADRLAGKFLDQLVESDEVAERFRHLFTADDNIAIVHPVLGKALAGAAGRLRDLVLVMRKDEVNAAAVDVEDFAQVFR